MSRDRSKVSVGNRESLYQYPSKYDNIKKYILSVYRATLKSIISFFKKWLCDSQFFDQERQQKIKLTVRVGYKIMKVR